MTGPATRLFVLTIGRSGSTAFAAACSHSTRFTVGHESRSRLLLPERLQYPDSHIEVDNRLVHYLELLAEQYSEDAGFVYLTRDPKAIVDSYLRRWHLSISAVRAHGTSTLLRAGGIDRDDRRQITWDYVRLLDTRIRWHMARHEHSYELDGAELRSQLAAFWDHFHLGDGVKEAAAALEESYNLNSHLGTQARLQRIAAKGARVLKALPAFVADA